MREMNQAAMGFGGRWPSLPLLQLWRDYERGWLGHDVLAGISVCVVMIPSVIAYAELAGLPPVQGLYAALAGMIAYAFFASSRQVIAGPDAAITLLVGTGIGVLAADDPSRAPALAAVVALLGGALMLIASRLKIGVIADFLSKPVLVGYLSGAALILVSTQVGKLFGLKISGHNFFAVVFNLATHLRESHLLTLGLGLGLMVVLELLKRFAPKIPGALVVFVLAIVVSVALGLQARGVAVIGDVPQGLPGLRLPKVSLDMIGELFPAAVGISLLTFPEGILLARAFAAKNRYEIRPNQELLALGVSNLAAGLFQGFSVGASQSRTTVSDATGGKTQMASLVAAGALILFLLFLTPLLRPLPVVTLAAILIFSGIHLIEIKAYRELFQISRPAFFLALLVTAGVLIVGVIPGILIGVMLSLIVLLGRLARPTDAVLSEVAKTGEFHDVGEAPEGQSVPGLIAYRFYAPLFFANADYFVERIRGLVAASTAPVRWVLVDMQAVTDIDVTAAEAMSRLRQELEERGILLKIARANRPLRERLARIGLGEHLGESNLFPSVHAGVAAFRQEQGKTGV
jgi:SulP family sulfate permease